MYVIFIKYNFNIYVRELLTQLFVFLRYAFIYAPDISRFAILSWKIS
jgi:hypothetical protein